MSDAAEVAADVAAQWELNLFNSYSQDQLKALDLSAVRLPQEWFADWQAAVSDLLQHDRERPALDSAD